MCSLYRMDQKWNCDNRELFYRDCTIFQILILKVSIFMTRNHFISDSVAFPFQILVLPVNSSIGIKFDRCALLLSAPNLMGSIYFGKLGIDGFSMFGRVGNPFSSFRISITSNFCNQRILGCLSI